MIAVIIAGGSGTRLWPLSTPAYPKHLLALTGKKTMVQNTFERAQHLTSDVYVVSEISHAHHVREQLPELDDDHFLIEPGRRGTANCIVSALAYVGKRHDADEPIVFLFADHHIRDITGFVRSFEIAAKISKEKNQITLIGIEPTYPATGFGYIERGAEIEGNPGIHAVGKFKEKPNYKTASDYLLSGHYLWNCGYFVGSLKTFIGEMESSAPDLKVRYEELRVISDEKSDQYAQTYLAFPNQVIDVELIEKTKNLVVVSANFDWMDLGSFQDLHKANDQDEAGNHIRGENIHGHEIENAYIRNEEGKPLIVIGLDNIAIVNTVDGILVTRKDLSQKVGDIIKQVDADEAV